MGVLGSRPAMNFHAWPAPPGLACDVVGMQSALHSAIGLPRRSTSALWMLVFLMPAEVSSDFRMRLLSAPQHIEVCRRRSDGVYVKCAGRFLDNACWAELPAAQA